MGKYTELNCAFSLKRHTPDEILDALLFMTGQDDDEPTELPSHPLFKTAHWRYLLRATDAGDDAQSYGMAGVELSETSGRFCVTIRRNLVNFGDEMHKFIDWITPYIFAHKGAFIGYTRSQDVEPVTMLLYPNRIVTSQLPDEIWGEPV